MPAIDWISFTVPLLESMTVGQGGQASIDHQQTAFNSRDWLQQWIHFGEEIKPTTPRRPYTFAWTTYSNGMTLYGGGNQPAMLVEISGGGCRILEKHQHLDNVLRAYAKDLTRLDICQDIETETKPDKFIDAGHSGRFKARGSQVSHTGHTEYLGSRKSDRYCRVYRYARPHPRSGLLRVEFVLKKQHAQRIGKIYVEHGLDEACREASAHYRFTHEEWRIGTPEHEHEPLQYTNRKNSKTLLWLLKQARPAFLRLVREGEIEDPEKWLKTYFLCEDAELKV